MHVQESLCKVNLMDKILIITTISGFLQQFEMNDVNILKSRGYEIHYASNFENPVYEMSGKELIEQGITLYQTGIQKSPLHILHNIRAWKELCRILKQEDIKVIHCHNPMGGVLGRLAAYRYKSRGIFVIYTAHGFHFYKGAPVLNWLLYYPVEYLLAKVTDCLITINREDYKRTEHFSLKKGGAVYRIPGVGVNTKKFSPKEELRRQVRERLHIEEDTFYILSVGEINSNKNHEVILRALAILKNEKIHYGLCGKGVLEKKLRRLSQKLGIEKQVTFFGFRTDIPRMLQGADCFIFPSKREGLGIAALEAMSAGLPMITSDCRGTREYMEDGVTGYVCQSNTPAEYAGLIRKMMEQPQMRKAMSEACIKKAASFDISVTDGIMQEIYALLPEI